MRMPAESARHEPEIGVKLVTPQLAQTWLDEKNVHNRRPKESNIARFARDMKAGRWQLTGEAIKFDVDGNLLDGQNRLFAVVRSGTAIRTVVVRGLPADSQEVMDSGAPRSAADALTLRGFRETTTVAAATRVYAGYRDGFYRHCMVDSAPRLTVSEQLEVIEAHPRLAEVAVDCKRHMTGKVRLPVGALATVRYVLDDIDAEDAAEYYDRLANMRTNGIGDPVHALLRKSQNYADRGQRIRVSTALFLLLRCWNAYRDGETYSQVILGAAPLWKSIPEPR